MLRELKEVAKQKVIAQGKRRFQSEVDIFTKMYAFTRAKTARAFHYYPYFPSIEQADATEVV
ncbi:MAG: 8-amino-7-oxononanoate synthase, partial [Candidatus Neomarinimicrobiota bacterium]